MIRACLVFAITALGAQAMMDEIHFSGRFQELVQTLADSRLSTIPSRAWVNSANQFMTNQAKDLTEEKILSALSQPLQPMVHVKIPKKDGSALELGWLPAPFQTLADEKTAQAYLQSLKLLKQCMGDAQVFEQDLQRLKEGDKKHYRYIVKQQKFLNELKDFPLFIAPAPAP